MIASPPMLLQHWNKWCYDGLVISAGWKIKMHTEFLLGNLLRIGAGSLGDRTWVEQFTGMTTALFWVIT